MNREKLLVRAIKEENIEAMRNLLSNPIEFTYKDTNGQAPLHYAANNSNEAILKLLLDIIDLPLCNRPRR